MSTSFLDLTAEDIEELREKSLKTIKAWNEFATNNEYEAKFINMMLSMADEGMNELTAKQIVNTNIAYNAILLKRIEDLSNNVTNLANLIIDKL